MSVKVSTTNYTVIYKTFTGDFVCEITEWFSLSYTKKENSISSMSIDLPPVYPKGYFMIDARMEIMKSISGGISFLECETIWLIQLIQYKTNENGENYIHILCHCANTLLDRRVVMYFPETSYTSKDTKCDTMIHEILRENLGSLATDTARSIQNWLEIEPDFTFTTCPTLKKSFAYQKVFPLVQEICDYSTKNNVYLAFDIVPKTESMMIFKTYTMCRGTDRGITTFAPLIFSIERGNLSYCSIALDHIEERNVIYAGGQGEGQTRIIKTSIDSVANFLSPYARREDWIDATQSDDPNYTQAEADSRLEDSRFKTRINAHIQQVSDCIYGYNYFFGDIVTIETEQGFSVDVHLDTVEVSVGGDGTESIVVYGRNLDDTEY
jgi:hypothetical protein